MASISYKAGKHVLKSSVDLELHTVAPTDVLVGEIPDLWIYKRAGQQTL